MLKSVGILGGASLIEEANRELSVEESVFLTVRQALANVGLGREQIDTVVQCADDVLDGISINHVYQVEAAASYLKDESKVERDGAWGVMYAMAKLLTGKFQTAMVVAYSKASQIGYSAFSGMSTDPFFLRPVGADGDGLAALQAQYYMQSSGATEQDFAELAAASRGRAGRNPRIMEGQGMEISARDVLNSAPIADPIRELSRARAGDGCVVLILASEEFIKANSLEATRIRGLGFASDAYYPTFRKLDEVTSAKVAVQKASQQSGLNPADVDFAEVQEVYAHQEMMLYESLGLSGSSSGPEWFRSSRDGRGVPVNPSGGTMCSHVPYATGLMRLYEAHLQIMGEAGPVQLGKADLGLVHAQAGLAMQSNIAFFLER
ncbi:MAG: hypothetical protein CMN77_11735 [Spirochaetaceae bacterium]|nr:hypothetical protein [Spirochaetaceae bacterium]|tara:strand:+ start:42699 stop:43832 length:1134 start_codon:yes stop_codon:yes gene_type:complete